VVYIVFSQKKYILFDFLFEQKSTVTTTITMFS